MVLGYNKTQRTCKVDIFLSVCHSRHLQGAFPIFCKYSHLTVGWHIVSQISCMINPDRVWNPVRVGFSISYYGYKKTGILPIYSRYVVGWMVAHREQATLAQRLISDSCEKQAIKPEQLIIHADRGSSMTSKPVAFLLSDLGITKSHSRPYVSNDNPYSEAHFKTLKYRPDFPDTFGSIEDVRVFWKVFLPGTTENIIIPASDSWNRKTSTMDVRVKLWKNGALS